MGQNKIRKRVPTESRVVPRRKQDGQVDEVRRTVERWVQTAGRSPPEDSEHQDGERIEAEAEEGNIAGSRGTKEHSAAAPMAGEWVLVEVVEEEEEVLAEERRTRDLRRVSSAPVRSAAAAPTTGIAAHIGPLRARARSVQVGSAVIEGQVTRVECWASEPVGEPATSIESP